MRLFHGIDLVAVARVRKSMENPHFCERVFSEEERAYLRTKSDPALAAAAGFAAKEAFSKALGIGLRGFELKEVAVVHDFLGKPEYQLSGKAKKLCEQRALHLELTLTHTSDTAAASAIGIGEEPYRTAVFDLDGTLLDSSEGVIASVQEALRCQSLPPLPREVARRFIGPPTAYSFEHYAHMNPSQVAIAFDDFERYYNSTGIFEAQVYDGIVPLLAHLRHKGLKLCVATLKTETAAREVLKHFGLLPYFDCVCGNNAANTRTKAELITECVRKTESSFKKTVLIGDTAFDLHGAEETGVDFIAAAYGFGEKDDFRRKNVVAVCDKPEQAAIYL